MSHIEHGDYSDQSPRLPGDLDALRRKDEDLAYEVETIGRKLDAGNFSGSNLSHEEERMGTSRKEHIGRERRRLVGEWESLVDRVRQLSNFRHFLRPTRIPELRQSDSVGKVVIINTSLNGVDALIFGATGPI